MRRASSWKVLVAAGALVATTLASGGSARANPTAEAGGEREHADRSHVQPGEAEKTPQIRLARGETLRYPQEADRAGGHYVGGVSYSVVDGPAAAITTLCEDAGAWRTFLPHVTGVRIVERRADDDLLVEITQGNALVDATYTLHVRLDVALGEARFWMVRSRPHDIADAWGYFRFTPIDVATTSTTTTGTPARTLVTVGVLVDVGEGWMRSLVEAKVQSAVLGVSDRVRDYVRYAQR